MHQLNRCVKIDVAQVNDQYFIQRLYTGIEPEEQTSREMKDRYGVFAYAVSIAQRSRTERQVTYRITVDGKKHIFAAVKLYVVNSGMMGTGFTITHKYAVDDGLLDVFILDSKNLEDDYGRG